MVTIRVPAPPPGLLSNLVGLLGLVAVVLAVAFLTDWRWGLLGAGLVAVGLAMLAQLRTAAVERPASVRPIRTAGKAA